MGECLNCNLGNWLQANQLKADCQLTGCLQNNSSRAEAINKFPDNLSFETLPPPSAVGPDGKPVGIVFKDPNFRILAIADRSVVVFQASQ